MEIAMENDRSSRGNAAQQQLSIISAKLDVLIALLLQNEEGKGPKRDKGALAAFLRDFGISYTSIALILGSSSNSVKVLLSQRRTKSREHGGAKGGK